MSCLSSRAYYERLAREAVVDLHAADRHTRASALGRMLTLRRGVSAYESYAAWCGEAMTAIEAAAAADQDE